MAHTSRTIDAAPGRVWGVLSDPRTYPAWLIGTKRVRDVEPDWPAEGSGFHHSVGARPFLIRDRTEVVEIEPGQLLDLAVRARPLVSARARFELLSDGARTVVVLQEEPALRVLGNLVRPVLDVATHVRNHRSLRNLDRFITGTTE